MTRATSVTDHSYEYYADGRLRYSHDYVDNHLDRSMSYDQAGRLSTAYTGYEARPNGTLSEGYGPYWQTYSYDAWGNMNSRRWRDWYVDLYGFTHPYPQTYAADYINHRNTAAGWGYDADGRLTTSRSTIYSFTSTSQVTGQFTHDAAGRLIRSYETNPNGYYDTWEYFDGDGQRVKFVPLSSNATAAQATTYYLRSSALGGQIITELNFSGQKKKGYVYGGGQVLAIQEGGIVTWEHRDPSNMTVYRMDANGSPWRMAELDPLGVQVDDQWSLYASGRIFTNNYANESIYGNPRMPDMGCALDGISQPCSLVGQFWACSAVSAK